MREENVTSQFLRLPVWPCPHLLVPGSSPSGSREFKGWTALEWKDLFIDLYKIRLRNYSVVGRLSGGRGLNSLVYAEGQ